MASYAEDLARWRVQRKQAEIQNRVSQIADEYREASRERDRAIADGDTETAECRDDDCIQLEAEYAQYVPPQPPQADPRAVEFFRRHAPFLEKYGQAGAVNLDRAHHYLMSRGWQPNTQKYFDGLRTLMEMYGKDFGTPYDPNDGQMLSATEAAKISGLSPKAYNYAVRAMAAQGRIGRGDR